MADSLPKKRRYDSSRRREQARLTRLQIAEVARRLFLERGYSGATIEAIAEGAHVANETVYAIFKNKRNILDFLLDISLGGDDQPMRILDRPGPQAVLHDSDQRRQLAAFAQDITQILDRAAPVFAIMRSAAKTEPEIAVQMKHLLKQRMDNMAIFVQHVAANGGLREGLAEAQAAEFVWTVTSPEVFQLLTGELDWPNEQYRRWLEGVLTRMLLP
jgi:AcrR family transcriptional regulator